MEHPDPWPLRHLVIRTPRLELRPDDDAGLLELVEETHLGIHPPEEMPFAVAWTDADPAVIGRLSLQHYWGVRAQFAPARWDLNLLVRHEGRVVGMQGLHATEFGISRELTTGSWIGMRNQRRGFGTEMRAAVLQFAFDHLGAVRARSRAAETSTASRRVSQKLGYREDGTECLVRRGEPTVNIRLVLDEPAFVRPGWTAEVEGLDGCRDLLVARDQPRLTPRANVSHCDGSPDR